MRFSGDGPADPPAPAWRAFLALLLVGPTILLSPPPQADRSPFGEWQRLSTAPIIAPRGDGWESAGTFNPAVITHEGKIVMLYRAQDKNGTSRLGYASSSDGIDFVRRATPVLSPETEYEQDGGIEDPRLVRFGDSRVVEPGPPPIVTKESIVLIYNGADDHLVYRTGIVRFDRADPRRVRSRTDTPVFAPETPWETTGQVPNVVFVEGMVRHAGRSLFYYGGADKYVGVAAGAAP
jgi:predicted GH43/DUF377 family glycosyl hydrolase